MNSAAIRLPLRVLRAQLFLGAILFFALTLFGPQLLLLDDAVAHATATFALETVLPLGLLSFLLTRAKLRQNRFVLRSLALGSSAIEPDDIARLSQVPRYAAGVYVALAGSTVVVFMLTPFRPGLLDIDTAFSLALLGLIIVATAVLPFYVEVRAAVARALELANPDAMVGLLDQAEATGRARRRLVWRLLLATATPVAFVSVGSSLITHAHVRKFDADSRERTAEIVARVALESSAGAVAEVGRAEAIEAAKEQGFAMHVERAALPFSVERDEEGRVSLTAPLDDGAANIRFRVTAIRPIKLADVGLALLAVGLAAALGLGLGQSLSTDLAQATLGVRALGNEEVLRGDDPLEIPARFAQVAALNRAIDTLAGRFRVFAHAQERAIEARDAARKLRSLLFASVSHDLKSPLNSILGFAELVRQKSLSAAQRESLGFIEQSGHELLVLIETILDMAKVEAGRMVLTRTKVSLGSVVAEAIRRGRLLAATRPIEFEVEVEGGLPTIMADESRLVQAIAALIWYSARSGEPTVSPQGTVRPVDLKVKRRVERGSQVGGEGSGSPSIVIEVEAPNSALRPEELERLLSPEPWAAGRRRYGGLTLGLGLARSLIELHHGSFKVKRTNRGSALFEVTLPVN